MSYLVEKTGYLTIVRCWCGVQHAVPQSLRDEQLRVFNDGGRPQSIYCPLGHTHVPVGQTRADELEKKLAAERARHDQTKAERNHLERSRSALKGQVTRVKNRVGNGVCPCCNRYFKDLHRHMQNQHPDFATEEVEQSS